MEHVYGVQTAEELADERDGDVHAVFCACRQWHKNPNGQTLAQWFQIE